MDRSPRPLQPLQTLAALAVAAAMTLVTTRTRAADPVPPANPWEVHEWGLVDAQLASTSVRIAAGPNLKAMRPAAVRKPVLYVHLGPGVESQTFNAGVEIPGGVIDEHWPPTELTPHGLVWKGVRATPGPCAARRSEPLRDAPAPACDGRDARCELGELPRYVTDDAACLKTSAGDASLLFYRGSATPVTLPLGLTLGPQGALTVHARGDMGGAPGVLIRVAMPCRGPVAPGEPPSVAVARIPGATDVTIPYPNQAPDRVALRTQLASDLAALGLTRSEANAFLDAWMDELFGRATPSDSRRELAPALPMTDMLLYWLPPAAIDGVATLAFEPRPTAVRRAMLVRVDLGATCTATGGPAVPR